MEQVFRDIRFALRALAKSPAFTFAVALILALGVGATTAIFTIANAAFLRPLPVEEPHRLVSIHTTDEKNPGTFSVAGENFLDFREQSRSFTDLVGHCNVFVNMAGEGEPAQVSGAMVTGTYFELLGLRPAAGRFFLREEDETPGTHPVLVLSYGSWENRFGRQDSIIGRELTAVPARAEYRSGPVGRRDESALDVPVQRQRGRSAGFRRDLTGPGSRSGCRVLRAGP